MASLRRLSMNTTLKEARIFDDSDEDSLIGDPNSVKLNYPTFSVEDEKPNDTPRKLDSNFALDFKFTMIKQEKNIDVAIKTEPVDSYSETVPVDIKQECIESSPSCQAPLNGVKQQSLESSTSSQNSVKTKMDYFWNIKREICEEDSLQDVFDSDNVPSTSKKMKRGMLDDSTNDDASKDSNSNHSLKSNKKSVFVRLSPYLKPRSKSSPTKIDPRIDQCVRNLSLQKTRTRKPVEYETDPEVLARRQKQIDFGKNTIGYDNYIRTVPRYKRTREEPSTPDKYKKYSRRGWDSLIKHWRLQLHNYD